MKAASKKGLRTLAARLEIEVEFLQECVLHGALSAEELTPEPSVPAASLARLRRLRRLCRDLDLDVFAGALVVELLERVDELRRENDGLKRL